MRYGYTGGDPVNRVDPTGLMFAQRGLFGNMSIAAAETMAVLGYATMVALLVWAVVFNATVVSGGYLGTPSPGLVLDPEKLAEMLQGLEDGMKRLGEALAILTGAGIQIAIETGGRVEDRPRNRPKLIYVTYTLTNPVTQTVYTGRTSGKGTPNTLMVQRAYGHHKIAQGYTLGPILDKWAYATLPRALRHGDPGYQAIRGREQQMIDFHGGSWSDGGTSGNAIRGVSRINPLGGLYHKAANAKFGQLHSYTGF